MVTVRRIVANIATGTVDEVREFYARLFDLDTVMDHGWIVTLASGETAATQISIASEGGSGTPVPDLSIEVDDVETVLQRARDMDAIVEYPLTEEPWGVRRFYLRDPAGRLVNVLEHLSG